MKNYYPKRIHYYLQHNEKKILVLIPCLNEEATLGNVIKNIRKYLPESRIVVYDNDSSDKTIDVAKNIKSKLERYTKEGRVML